MTDDSRPGAAGLTLRWRCAPFVVRRALHAYVRELESTLPEIHPAGRASIGHWLADMLGAARTGDVVEFARLESTVQDKVRQELEWQRQDAEKARNPLTSKRV